MRFNKAKCKVLHLDQGNPQCQYKKDDEGMEHTYTKRDHEGSGEQKIGYEQSVCA